MAKNQDSKNRKDSNDHYGQSWADRQNLPMPSYGVGSDELRPQDFIPAEGNVRKPWNRKSTNHGG